MIEKFIPSVLQKNILKNLFLALESFIKEKIIDEYTKKDLLLKIRQTWSDFPDIDIENTFLTKNPKLFEEMYSSLGLLKKNLSIAYAYKLYSYLYRMSSNISFSVRKDVENLNKYLKILDGYFTGFTIPQFLISKIEDESGFLFFLYSTLANQFDLDPSTLDNKFDEYLDPNSQFIFDSDILFSASTLQNTFYWDLILLCSESYRDKDLYDFFLSKETSKLFYELANRLKPLSTNYFIGLNFNLELKNGLAKHYFKSYNFTENSNYLVFYLFDEFSLKAEGISKKLYVGRESFYDLEILKFLSENNLPIKLFSEEIEEYFFDSIFNTSQLQGVITLDQKVFLLTYFAEAFKNSIYTSNIDISKMDIFSNFFKDGFTELYIADENDSPIAYIGLPKFYTYTTNEKLSYTFNIINNTNQNFTDFDSTLLIRDISNYTLDPYDGAQAYDYDNNLLYCVDSSFGLGVYDFVNDTYTVLTNSTTRMDPIIYYYNNKIYMVGGGVFDSVRVYDIQNNSFYDINYPSNFLVPHYTFFHCRVDEDTLYLFGGKYISQNGPVSLFNLIQFNFSTETFTLYNDFSNNLANLSYIGKGKMVYYPETNSFKLFNFEYVLQGLNTTFYSDNLSLSIKENLFSNFINDTYYEYILNSSNEGPFYIFNNKFLLGKDKILLRFYNETPTFNVYSGFKYGNKVFIFQNQKFLYIKDLL